MGNQTNKKFVVETNDFVYYMSLLRKNIDTKFTGKLEDLQTLKEDIELYINVMKTPLIKGVVKTNNNQNK